MADWQTISSLATAGGTLILASATFAAVRSPNRAARDAEHSLLSANRPLLLPSGPDDPRQRVLWNDQHVEHVEGGRAIASEVGGVIDLAISLRNVGSGLALLHGWHPRPGLALGAPPVAPEEHQRLSSISTSKAEGRASDRSGRGSVCVVEEGR